jgi:hypothetical protein
VVFSYSNRKQAEMLTYRILAEGRPEESDITWGWWRTRTPSDILGIRYGGRLSRDFCSIWI